MECCSILSPSQMTELPNISTRESAQPPIGEGWEQECRYSNNLAASLSHTHENHYKVKIMLYSVKPETVGKLLLNDYSKRKLLQFRVCCSSQQHKPLYRESWFIHTAWEHTFPHHVLLLVYCLAVAKQYTSNSACPQWANLTYWKQNGAQPHLLLRCTENNNNMKN